MACSLAPAPGPPDGQSTAPLLRCARPCRSPAAVWLRGRSPPTPNAANGQALDSLGLTKLAGLDGAEHSIQLIELQLLHVHLAQKSGRWRQSAGRWGSAFILCHYALVQRQSTASVATAFVSG